MTKHEEKTIFFFLSPSKFNKIKFNEKEKDALGDGSISFVI